MYIKTGILERIYDEFLNSIDLYGFINYQDIVKFVKELQKNEFDAHVLITSQNGVGKSMLALSLGKLIDPDFIAKENIIYAYNTTQDFIDKLVNNKDSVIMCDEINAFFNYKQSMTARQIALFNSIEIARSQRNVLLSCCRDARRINNNYRNGKVQIVIWIIDRYDTLENLDINKPVGYAMVFVANPILEHEDKFGFDTYFLDIQTIEDMRIVGEQLNTFVGYMIIDHVLKYITPQELDLYKEQKRLQIIAQSQKNKRLAKRSGEEIEAIEKQQLLSLYDDTNEPDEIPEENKPEENKPKEINRSNDEVM